MSGVTRGGPQELHSRAILLTDAPITFLFQRPEQSRAHEGA